MIIEDFIMLGRTAPNESKKHGLSVCSAGYSQELGGFVRVYPLPPNSKIQKWSKCRIPLMRSKHDNRIESWRLNNGGDNSESVVQILGKAEKDIEFEILEKTITTIEDLNNKRASLGIIKPDSYKLHFDKLSPNEEKQQDIFFSALPIPNGLKPKVKFGSHDIQLLDWGCYEFLRKYPSRYYDIWDALHLHNDNYEHLFFVGNMNAYRNNWQIISTISRKKIPRTQDLFRPYETDSSCTPTAHVCG